MSDVLARIARLESDLAIRRLASDYAHGSDKRQLDRFLSVWHDDAVWDTGEEFIGLEAIGAAAQRQWDGFRNMHHLTGNHVIDIQSDRATGESDVLVTVQLMDGTWLRAAGVYHDSYERRAGVWKLSARRATVVFSVDPLPDSIRH